MQLTAENSEESIDDRRKMKINHREHRGIGFKIHCGVPNSSLHLFCCHSALDAESSSYFFWIPASAGMTKRGKAIYGTAQHDAGCKIRNIMNHVSCIMNRLLNFSVPSMFLELIDV